MLARILLTLILAAAPALAQQTAAPPPDAPAPPVIAAPPPVTAAPIPIAPGPAVPAPAASAPAASSPVVAPAPAGVLFLSAQFSGVNRTIPGGVVWRVFPETGGGEMEKPLAASNDPSPSFRLEPGAYIVHMGYGLAGMVRRVNVGQRETNERFSIAAGALKLAGAIGQAPASAALMNFTIYAPLPNNSEGRLVAQNVKTGDVVRLPEGAYHVVSSYGDTNSIMRAELKVDSGRVTEATMNHRAATVTLKLVINPGGEALAGTAFSVLTPGGDIIREAIGAFPSLILAESEYIVIARHQGKAYQRPFKVESGLDRDIEVLAR